MSLRVAVLGAGVGAQHVAGCLASGGAARAALVVDLDRARAEAAAAPAGARVGTALETALSDPDVDVVDVCLPPHLHLPVCEQALAAGKHVICEKPLVTSLAEMDRLERAAAAAERRVFPVFQYRYGPAMAALRGLAAADLLGAPLAASLETHWDRRADYYAAPWRGTWAGERGGAVLSHAIHAHDLLACAFGPVAAVSAATATRANPVETEDCAALSVTMACGAVASSSITLGAAGDETRLRLAWSRLTATSGVEPYRPAEGAWTFRARDPADQPAVDAAVAAAAAAPCGYAGLFADVAAALAGDPAAAPPSLAHGRASLAFVTAVYAAARTGVRESLPIPRDHPLYSDWRPPSACP